MKELALFLYLFLRGYDAWPDSQATRLFGCFDAGAGLAPSAERRFALSASASPKQRADKTARSLPRHLRIGLRPTDARKASPTAIVDMFCWNCVRKKGLRIIKAVCQP